MSYQSDVPVLLVEGLRKTVSGPGGDLCIVDDININILAAESVAIIGPSGAGKSTLLGLLAGLDTPSAGRVVLSGHDLGRCDEDERARIRGELVGFVFQSFHLLPTLTALENVMLPLELSGAGNARATATAALARVGLERRLQHYPAQLSGGEQQRVAIARAFAPRPKLLLADEPTGNLDSRTGAQVIELLFSLNEEAGATLVLVTHDDTLAKRCRRRLVLDAGRLVAA